MLQIAVAKDTRSKEKSRRNGQKINYFSAMIKFGGIITTHNQYSNYDTFRQRKQQQKQKETQTELQPNIIINYNHDTSCNNISKHLCSINDLPEWYKCNKIWIIEGYRINFTPIDALKSIFEWHNETLNIWTEIIPMIFFILLNIYCIIKFNFWWYDANLNIKLISISFWIFPLRNLASVTCHTLYCVNKKYFQICWKLDFASIVLMTGMLLIVCVYLLYYCFNMYVKLTLVILMFILLIPSMHICITTNNLKLKNGIIGAFATVGVFQLNIQIMFILTDGYQILPFPTKIIIVTLLIPILFAIGLFCYSTEFPEKKINHKTHELKSLQMHMHNINKSGSNHNMDQGNSTRNKNNQCGVNYICTSHQIWHCFGNLVQLCLFLGAFWYAQYRLTNQTC